MKKLRKLKALYIIASIDLFLSLGAFATFVILLVNVLNKLDPEIDKDFGFYNVTTYLFLVVAVVLLIVFLTLLRFIGRTKHQVVKERLIKDDKIQK